MMKMNIGIHLVFQQSKCKNKLFIESSIIINNIMVILITYSFIIYFSLFHESVLTD